MGRHRLAADGTGRRRMESCPGANCPLLPRHALVDSAHCTESPRRAVLASLFYARKWTRRAQAACPGRQGRLEVESDSPTSDCSFACPSSSIQPPTCPPRAVCAACARAYERCQGDAGEWGQHGPGFSGSYGLVQGQALRQASDVDCGQCHNRGHRWHRGGASQGSPLSHSAELASCRHPRHRRRFFA